MNFSLVNILRSILSNGLVRAIVLGQARHWIAVGGALLLTWLQSKGAPQDAASQIAGDLTGAALVAVPAALQWLDAQGVDIKMKAALAAQPGTKLETIDALKQGKF